MRRGRSSKGSSLRRVVFVNASRHTPLRPARAICAAVLVVVSLATGSSAEVVSLEPDEPWCVCGTAASNRMSTAFRV
jgi:hypothetical protein